LLDVRTPPPEGAEFSLDCAFGLLDRDGGRKRSQRAHEAGGIRERPKEGPVACLDHDDGLVGQAPSCGGGGERSRSRVVWMRGSFNKLAALECAQDLGGHHRIGRGVVGELALADRSLRA